MKFSLEIAVQSTVSLLMIAIVGSLVLLLIRRANEKKESKQSSDNFVICIPRYLIIVALVATIVSAIGSLLVVFLSDKELMLVVLPILILVTTLGFLSALSGIKERICIIENDIIFKPAFGKKRQYSFSQIDKVVSKSNSQGATFYYVYVGNKRIFTVGTVQVGYDLFLCKLDELNIQITCK